MRRPPVKDEPTSVEVISVLFTDLVDSTALASRLGPAAADDLQVEFFQMLRSGLEASSGREVKNLGDGLMFAFPSPSMALDAAMRMQQALDRRNRDAENVLSVRMGLSMGEVTQLESDYYGRAVVEGARLCALARGGQILVTDVMRMLAGRGDHRFKSVGALELKGLPEPVPACELVWEPLEVPGRAVPLPPRLQSAPAIGFVGRVPERAQLERLLDGARGGERGVALISGEPGIGKTRLCTDLVIDAHETGVTVLYGRCEEDVAAPYGPWIEALGHYVEHAPESVLKAHTVRHGGELVRLVPDLARRVGGLPPPRDSDPETERYLLWAAAAELLEEASRESPIALVLDDLHQADRQSLSLLLRVATSPIAARLLVLGTYRDSDLTRRHPLTELLAVLRRERDDVTRIQLAGLEEPEISALMEAAAGHELDRTGQRLAHEIQRESDGNPFFVAELLRHLVESGALYRGAEGRWALRGSLAELGLPRSVRDVIDRRVERLGEEVTRVLHVAAVIGREFDFAVLHGVVGGEEDALLDLLDEARGAAIIGESEPGRFTFTHALINHVLYEGLGPTRRARAHQQVAEALERLCGDEPGARLDELATHWTQATVAVDASKAVEYGRRAGEKALAELAPDEALRWFTKALELPAKPDAAAERCDLLIGLGEAQRQIGAPEFRDTLLEAARTGLALGDHDRLARAALANTRGFVETGRVDDERVEILEAAAERLSADHPRRAEVLTLLAMELTWAGQTQRRVALAREGLALARTNADTDMLARALDRCLYAIWLPGTLQERLDLSAELVALAEAGRDPLQRQMAYNRRIYYVIEAGRGDDADHIARGMRETAARFTQPFLQWVALYQSAMVEHMHGRIEAAEALCDQAVAVGTNGGEPDALLIYAAQLVGIRYDQGRVGEVLEVVAQSVEDFPLLPAWHGFYVTALCQLGRTDDARAQLAAVDLDALPDDFLLPATLSYYAEACADLGAVSLAPGLSARLEPFHEQVATNGVTVIGPVSHCLGRLAATGGDYDRAAHYFERAIATCRELDAPVMQARTEIAWAQALRAVERTGAGERVEELIESARARADEFGARDLARRIDAVAAKEVGSTWTHQPPTSSGRSSIARSRS